MANAADALIIGGGPAGLTAALTLARQQQTSFIFDAGTYRNDPADFMHLIPGFDHVKPSDFRSKANDNLAANYPEQIAIHRTTVVKVQKDASTSEITLTDHSGTLWTGKKLILAVGVEDIFPAIDGYAECWGKGIFHCLFCKGFEERGCNSAGVLAIGGLSKAPLALHVARQAAALSRNVTIYTNGGEDVARDVSAGIGTTAVMTVDDRKIVRLEKQPDKSAAAVRLIFEDGSEKLEGFLAHTPQTKPRGPFVEQLGLEQTPSCDIKAGPPFFETSVKGVFAAGDSCGMMKNICAEDTTRILPQIHRTAPPVLSTTPPVVEMLAKSTMSASKESHESGMHSLFAMICSHSRDRPESIACSQGERSMTYRELETASLSLAAFFHARGVQGGHTVPICLSRTLESVASVIALLRLGACFVPIDAESWSQARVDSVLQVVEPKLVIVSHSTKLNLDKVPQITAHEVQRVYNGDIAEFGFSSVDILVDGSRSVEEPVYIIFTSGTTGIPKGVIIPRRCVEYYVRQESSQGMPFNLGLCPEDTVLLLFSLAFDAAWGVFFSTLCKGAHLVLSEPENVLQNATKCTILPATPSLLGTLGSPEAYNNIKSIFLGGESPSPGLLQKWWRPQRRIFNCYGPTEATICTSMAELKPSVPITLGHPIPGTELLILNDLLEESTEGELYISGPCLASGYFKNHKLTSERFISRQGTRVYRTLDRVRRISEGIVFCGRQDSVVKNRGYLVNLEMDVLPILLSYPGVEAATAFKHQDKLVAAVTPDTISVKEMRYRLSQLHDPFVVPDQILAYRELHKTSNGKIDANKLKDQISSQQMAGSCNTHGTQATILQEAVCHALNLDISSISMNFSFWELGGNSLLAIKLLSYLRERNQTLQLQDIFESPSLLDLSERLNRCPPELVDQEDKVVQSSQEDSSISAAITATQNGMIRSSIQRSPTSYMVVSIDFPWSSDAGHGQHIRDVWGHVLRRHSIFHTSFDLIEGLQILDSESHRHHDWKESILRSDSMCKAKDIAISRLLASTRVEHDSHIFRPVNSFRLIIDETRLRANLLWLIHHSLIDGYSMGLVIQEVRAVLRGETLSNDPPQFFTIASQVSRVADQTGKSGRRFWQEALNRIPNATPLTLPKPTLQESLEETQLGEVRAIVDLPLSRVDRICRVQGVTSASMIYAAWALLLSSYTSQEHVLFGTVFSGRHIPVSGIDKVVGPVLNSCPLPVDLSGSTTKAQLLLDMHSLLLRVSSHQWSAAEALQQLMPGSVARAFETMLFLEYDLYDFPEDDEWHFARTDAPEFELTVLIAQENNCLNFRALFDQSKYTRPVIQRMMNHFRNLFLGLLDHKCDSVADVRDKMLDACESLALTTNAATLMAPYTGPSNLKALFENGVDRWPDAVAVEAGDRQVAYRELDRLTNYVASAVAAHVRPGSAVAVLSDRSLGWIISVLAVIKAGAAYVPLDTSLPIERMKIMTSTSEAQLVIFPDDRFTACFDGQKLVLGDILAGIGDRICPRQSTAPRPEDVAYITFTSGSTGVPKGVRIKHQSVVSYLAHGPARMDARPGRRHAQMFSPGFDVNQAEIFGTLCYGATLVLVDPLDPFAHLSRVNATMITPSFLSVCEPEDYPNLDTILFAGESVPQALADRWAGSRTVYNSYGPCECTIGCLFKQLRPYEEVTLGQSIDRVGVYILDSHNRPVPVGLPGEICLSGIQIADGYIGPDLEILSQARFVADPFVHGQRMYRTGDCAVWTEDSEPKFLGRFDHQVKVRGYRVELIEIENVIRLVASDVRRAAAIVNNDNIIAFVEPDTVDIRAIDKAMRSKLPAYTCPSMIVALENLPTMPNQKLDRQALHSKVGLTSEKAHRPLTKIQSLLAEAWREALGLSKSVGINADTDFMELGGNSLSQVKLAQIVSRMLGDKIPLKIFIWNPTLGALGDKIEDWQDKPASSSHATAFNKAWKTIQGPFTRVSHLEEEFFHLSSLHPSQTYNVAIKLQLTGSVDMKSLENAIDIVTSREAILRSRFYISDGQLLRGQSSIALEVTKTDMKEWEVQTFINRPFDLSTGPMTRINLSQHGEQTGIILVQHHAITDKTGIKIFLNSIRQEYLKLLGSSSPGTEKPLSPESPDYTVWAQWKAGQPQLCAQDSNAAYWKSQLSELPVPAWKTLDPSRKTFDGRSETFTLKRSLRWNSCLELYMAVVAIALSKVQPVANDVLIGIPHIDRTEPGTEDMLGVFLDRLPVRMKVAPIESLEDFRAYIESARTSTRNALAHAMPLKDIRTLVGADELFPVMLVHNSLDDSIAQSFQLPGVTVDDVALKPTGAKFPLLIEFTEGKNCTTCDFEYMENIVSPATAGALRLYIQRIMSSFG
ncbi:hypothetical protein UA08_08292 [Talaromyces atroroseus]|uniref:Carrier domain-containing protein n=1 Tax=Talaromyces atroroseus TaxID=1441469 RepID=A0A225AT69_TALAT|nr:hypothetical protein UA08_08292 [Talaromyces atroroseus]OKL56657.1 hypothetical protein UA08_08292 [Talaromyces atroroseus]